MKEKPNKSNHTCKALLPPFERPTLSELINLKKYNRFISHIDPEKVRLYQLHRDNTVDNMPEAPSDDEIINFYFNNEEIETKKVNMTTDFHLDSPTLEEIPPLGASINHMIQENNVWMPLGNNIASQTSPAETNSNIQYIDIKKIASIQSPKSIDTFYMNSPSFHQVHNQQVQPNKEEMTFPTGKKNKEVHSKCSSSKMLKKLQGHSHKEIIIAVQSTRSIPAAAKALKVKKYSVAKYLKQNGMSASWVRKQAVQIERQESHVHKI